MNPITPISGWLLFKAVEIDAAHPGFAGHILRCSTERRHVIAAYLSRRMHVLRFETEGELGAFLSCASHDEILRAAFTSVPVGYRKALGRGGHQPYIRRYYTYLHALMSSDRRPSMLRLIPHLPKVNPTRLRVARALPADLRQPNLVMALKDQRIARDVADLIQLLQEAGSDRKAMVRSIAVVESFGELRDWARRWAFRVQLPAHPVPHGDGYTPVQTGEELKRLALRHRNCARNYLANTLEERSAFAIVYQGKSEAVVHLIREADGWVLDDLYGIENSEPDAELVQRAETHLARHGISRRGQRPRPERRWSALRSIAGHMDYGGGWHLD